MELLVAEIFATFAVALTHLAAVVRDRLVRS